MQVRVGAWQLDSPRITDENVLIRGKPDKVYNILETRDKDSEFVTLDVTICFISILDKSVKSTYN